ncbi:hypothetical protein TcWFU_004578 [Taenia crassiceps]|uniref:FAR1 domain-containing protein n=1 Tax=Taenia crassiceps TaxID=6207 RepID=A0ABR4Q9B9_9CEST
MVHNHAVVYNPAFKQHGVDGIGCIRQVNPLDDDGYDVRCDLTVPIEEAIQYPQATHLSASDDSLIDYNVVYDVTTQFVEIFSSGRFPTYQDFLVRLEEFQRETGCLYSKRMSNMWPAEAKDKEHLVYKFVIFDCVHFGYTRDNSRRRSTQRRAGFCFRGKVGCKSTMRISTIKGYVEIVTYEMRHNHPASQEASDEYQPQTWLLSGINVGDDDKAFKRRRRSKKQVLADSALAQAEVVAVQKTDIISDQLAKLRDVALAAPPDKLEIFCNQLSEFEARWRQQLMAAYQEQQQQDPSQSQSDELPDPNASPPIIPVSASIKLETL